MKKTALFLLAAVIFFLGVSQAMADQEWIRDILEKKDRYWNRTLTVVGQVLSVQADPPGTTRGTYQLQDESARETLTVASNSLPPVGKTYAVTGIILQAPETSKVYMKETKRSSPGFPPTMKILLFGGSFLFLVLLIIFIILLVRPRQKATARGTIRPGPRPDSEALGLEKTRKIEAAVVTPSAPDKTQVFISLGADIIVEKGPDQGKEFALHKQVTTIGRPGSRKNDVELADDTVSKEQASIFYDNTKRAFSIRNESTTNPTRVNKNVITEATVLQDGDLIEMGKTVLKIKME